MHILVYLPQYDDSTYLLYTAVGESAALRKYTEHGYKKTPLPRAAVEAMLKDEESDCLRQPNETVENFTYWYERIQERNLGLEAADGIAAPEGHAALEVPPALDHAEDVALVARRLDALKRRFCQTPQNFFSEADLHASFYACCRGRFGTATPLGAACSVDLFRHEYNTIWRYRRIDGFATRYVDEGTPGSLDFALLDRGFVTTHDMVTVRNKREQQRALLRQHPHLSPAIVVGIEFKMEIARSAAGVGLGRITPLKEGMLEDCRKLAHERIPHAFVVAFSHGPEPGNQDTVHEMLSDCITTYRGINHDGTLTVRLITPTLSESMSTAQPRR